MRKTREKLPKSSWPSSERHVARPVVDELTNENWDVYQEVPVFLPHLGSEVVADIVAVRDGVIWVIECKRTLSFQLLAQANQWLPYAHRVSIAIPTPKKDYREISFINSVLSSKGIGCFSVRPTAKSSYDEECLDGTVTQLPLPALHRRVNSKRIKQSLLEGQKTFKDAGSSGGARFSKFRNTVELLKAAAKDNPGIALNDALRMIEHHYSSDKGAFSCIVNYIQKGVIKDLEIKTIQKKYCLFLKESK